MMVEVATAKSRDSGIGSVFGKDVLEIVVLRRDDVEEIIRVESGIFFLQFFFTVTSVHCFVCVINFHELSDERKKTSSGPQSISKETDPVRRWIRVLSRAGILKRIASFCSLLPRLCVREICLK